MASKVTLITLAKNDSTTTDELNTNFTRLADQIDKQLSRDGSTPNQMESVLDMNSNKISNLAKPKNSSDAARKKDIDDTGDLPAQDGEAGNFLKSDGSTATWNQIAAADVTEISNLTVDEGAQLENIDSVTITNTQWGHVGSMDQGVSTSDSPTFANVTGADTNFVSGTAGTDGNLTQWNADGDAVDSGTAQSDVLVKPGTSTDPGLAFDTWRTPNANRPTLISFEAQARTDGSTNGVVSVDVDESGGTTPDYNFRVVFAEDAMASSAADVYSSFSLIVPAGGAYRIVNDSDPSGENTIRDHREFTI